MYGDGAGQFTVRLIGSSDSSRPACWDQGRGVLLADTDSDSVSVYTHLPLVVADTDDAWCEAGHFTLEVTAASAWIVVLTNQAPPSGDESDDDHDDRGDNGGTSPGAVLVNDAEGTVEILGYGDTETTVTLDEGLWTAASSVRSNESGRFVVRLRPPAASASTRCKLGDRSVILADGSSGQTFIDSTLPVLISNGAYMGVSVAGGYACGLMTDGSAVCWGARTTGRADPPDVSFAQISAGPDYACGIRTDGYVQCWG